MTNSINYERFDDDNSRVSFAKAEKWEWFSSKRGSIDLVCLLWEVVRIITHFLQFSSIRQQMNVGSANNWRPTSI